MADKINNRRVPKVFESKFTDLRERKRKGGPEGTQNDTRK